MDPVHFIAIRAAGVRPTCHSEDDFYEHHSFERWHGLLSRARQIIAWARRPKVGVQRPSNRIRLAHAR